ncbi:hypothetical protein LTR78_008479 [Recurvomyces mirabilis]|uniref:Required for respiratory growth protein 7, mitochondrial n=1 Tax=Recurvomyces mirabilis TaxID=574656 RepID=A0AAE0TPW5_9PEZI|nr:hypothetical protein LTR78_008479 [Recurvomyces mirabilis]KAK5156231.1 hypothetical protein LTS14_005118 [Recurvomyces mirabilis]
MSLVERQAALDLQLQKPQRRRRTRTAKSPSPGEDTQATDSPSSATPPAKTVKTRKRKEQIVPRRLLPPTEQKHTDLTSFISYADQQGLSNTSTVYRGTHYEYTVANSLATLNFHLRRIGRANDLGIDLVGHWSLPSSPKAHALPVLVQCKAAKPTPSMVRELDGTYTGAPAGWQGDGVLALLSSIEPSTKGVQAAVQRSQSPLGVLQITRDGQVKQFLWNAAAAAAGLEGLGVAVRYATKRGGVLEKAKVGESSVTGKGSTIGLTWMGKPWLPLAIPSAAAAESVVIA